MPGTRASLVQRSYSSAARNVRYLLLSVKHPLDCHGLSTLPTTNIDQHFCPDGIGGSWLLASSTNPRLLILGDFRACDFNQRGLPLHVHGPESYQAPIPSHLPSHTSSPASLVHGLGNSPSQPPAARVPSCRPDPESRRTYPTPRTQLKRSETSPSALPPLPPSRTLPKQDHRTWPRHLLSVSSPPSWLHSRRSHGFAIANPKPTATTKRLSTAPTHPTYVETRYGSTVLAATG